MRRTLCICAFLGYAGVGEAAIVAYSGSDVVAAISDPHPGAKAADSNFTGALGSGFTSLNFENVAVGTSNRVTPAAGVSVSWVNQEFNTIRNTGDLATGFNTTPGGTNFLSLDSSDISLPVDAIFTFAKPIDAFGAYFTGAGDSAGGVSIKFTDGSFQSLSVVGPNSKPPGYVGFFGFTDLGKAISSVTIEVGTQSGSSDDIIGVDDVRFQSVPASATPEPTALPILGILLGAAWLRSRQSRRKR